ncbi:MAG: 2-oxo acid dehydrogenase subunit E2 [Phycisphaerales bacterium]|nr:2-oxo acid dehydrogenase subunit E2 [Phycisphaerales bacterium]
MPIDITMPRLSDTMQQGTIVKWNIKEGQKVKSGDVIADIETDKATMELQTFDDGTVAKLAVAEGQQVPVGTVIAVLAGAGEDAGAVKSSGSAAAPAAKTATVGSASTPGPTSSAATATTPPAAPTPGRPAQSHNGNGAHAAPTDSARILVSPLARKIAEESGVDLRSVQGTGPAGRIVRKDVEAALAGGGAQARPGLQPAQARTGPAMPPLTSTLEGKVIPLSNMRRIIATRLVESKQTVPHYQVTVEVDMDALMALRAQLNEQLADQGVKLSVNDFLVRACALAMHKHPYVNSRWVPTPGQESIELLPDVNIGIAIALPEERGGGLVVATIRAADQIGLRQVSGQSKQLADKARAKGLTPQEMSDSTFTISNLGMFGVSHFTAIINPPNVAILAVGGAIERPVVRDGQVVIGHIMSMTMSSDHRVVDGAMAAAYLNTVKGLLEKPATLLV